MSKIRGKMRVLKGIPHADVVFLWCPNPLKGPGCRSIKTTGIRRSYSQAIASTEHAKTHKILYAELVFTAQLPCSTLRGPPQCQKPGNVFGGGDFPRLFGRQPSQGLREHACLREVGASWRMCSTANDGGDSTRNRKTSSFEARVGQPVAPETGLNIPARTYPAGRRSYGSAKHSVQSCARNHCRVRSNLGTETFLQFHKSFLQGHGQLALRLA